MRGLGKLAAAPCCPTTAFAASQSVLSFTSSNAYSTFSDGGGGRGRGRGSGHMPQTTPPPRVPGKTGAEADEDSFVSPGLGHGRGHTVLPSSPVLPSFSSWMSSPPPSAAGRGRGRTPPPPNSAEPSDSHPKMPIFFRQEDSVPPPAKAPSSDPEPSAPLPSRFAPALPVAGRGKPTKQADSDARANQENRHRRPRAPVGSPEHRPLPNQPKLGQEEAVRKAMEVLNRPGGGRDVRERGGRGRARGRGIGRGRSRGRRFDDPLEDSGLYLGDNADGERLQKRLGEENMKLLNEAFDEMSGRVLPSPSEEAYLDALHTNNMIEYEPEYLVEFDRNPDIDEKPPMSLEDALEKAKPFLMAYEGIQSQEEWEEIVKETMEKVPYMKELMDMYCGPDRVTAKQQQQELERVAKTLPENIPSSVKRFTDRAVLSLQSNPGWGWDKKCQFMDKLVWEVSQQYK